MKRLLLGLSILVLVVVTAMTLTGCPQPPFCVMMPTVEECRGIYPVATAAGKPVPAPSVIPTYVAADQFSDAKGYVYQTPLVKVMSKGQIRALLADLAKLKSFAKYPYSGCHDRAHALYLQLIGRFPEQLLKIWIFAPRLLSPAMQARLHYQPAQWEEPTSWDYHVALAFRKSAHEIMVIDPAVEQTAAISLHAWFQKFQIPPGAVWTLIEGDRYSFSRTLPSRAEDRNAFNGYLFRYENSARNCQFLPKNLARDTVAVALHTKSDCQDLKLHILFPDKLLKKLEGPLPAECSPYQELFHKAEKEWTDYLNVPPEKACSESD